MMKMLMVLLYWYCFNYFLKSKPKATTQKPPSCIGKHQMSDLEQTTDVTYVCVTAKQSMGFECVLRK